MSVDIEIRFDADAFRMSLRKESEDLMAVARQVLGQGVMFALQHARATQLFKDQTGELRRSIVRGQTGPWSLFIKATAPHAKYVEFGTADSKKGPIVPRRGRALAFNYHGTLMFRKSVKHKGMKARPFMQQAAEVAESYYDYYFESSIAKVFR